MKNQKKTGAAKVAPKGDTTQKRRQSRRRERLNEIAKASGFASWSAYETACLNGVAKVWRNFMVLRGGGSVLSRPPLTQTVGRLKQ